MITLDINPFLLQFGSLQIRYYGLVFVFGFLSALYVVQRSIKKGYLSLTKEKGYDLIFYLLVGVLLGARVFHILFWGLDYYYAEPLKILFLWQGGLSFHGGLVGAILSLIIFTRKHKLSFWHVADVLTLPAIFVLALGRVANFINQEILGTITQLPWCVKFLQADPLHCRHPVQLYGALGRFFTFFLLLQFNKKHKDGFIFWMFLFLMGVGRLFLDFLREDLRYLGLSAGQWLSNLMGLYGGYVLIRYYKEDFHFGLLKKDSSS